MRTTLFAMCVAALVPALGHADDSCPIQRLEAEAGFGGSFGSSMLIESGRLLISDWGGRTACPAGGDPFSCTAGAIYSFALVDGQWVDRQLIYPWDIGFNEGFGSFDAEGDRMIATTARRNQDSRQGIAHVYEFDHDSGEWFEFDRFQAPDAPYLPPRGFGTDIALRGDSVLISRGETVFLFRKGGEHWELVQTIDRFDPTVESDQFGYRLEMNDDWAIIAALRDRTRGYDNGALYVYRRDDAGLLAFHEKVLPHDPLGGFEHSMSLDGSTLAIWGYGAAVPGSILVYELTDEGLEFRQEVSIAGTSRSIQFGIGVSLSGDTMVAGSRRGLTNERVGYVFRRGSDDLWRQVAELDPRPAVPGTPHTSMAHATATDGRFAVIGSPYEWPDATVEGTGAAYSFDLDCEICEPDLDLDGSLTIFDFLTYLNLFQDGDPQADFDGDGELTLFDFLAFQTAFDAGC